MKYKTRLAAAGWLAFAGFSLMVSNAALAVSSAAQDPANVAMAPSAASTARSYDNVTSAEDYAVLMEREAARWEGPANVENGRAPGSALD
jgi:hypothetical protein